MKVVHSKSSLNRPALRRPKLATKRVRTTVGGYKNIYIIDANSPSFTEELTEVFRRNVRKARAENKRLFGSPDGPNAEPKPKRMPRAQKIER